MMTTEQMESLVEIAANTGRLSAYVEYLEAFARRLGHAADRHDLTQLEAAGEMLTLAELGETLARFVDVMEPIARTVRRLDAALPRPN